MDVAIVILFLLCWLLASHYLKTKGQSLFLRNAIGILFGFCTVFLWFMLSSMLELHQVTDATPDSNPAPLESPVASEEVKDDGVLTAQQYWFAYQANEVAADLKFRSKPVTIKGVVRGVRKGAFGGMYVDLATADEHKDVSTSFETELEAYVAKLSKGDQVILTCIGNGLSFGVPTLRNCTSE
ncbi:OB-fold protein [Duganella qianjiadongensis]|uniref:tRNA_anti-like n=1 Tax=Duganella qianjiadongensis TaxID=2692176 RepID=A0ABW9VQU9_9BURK|nr:hypothetical protein [Duganella qianjiadongensis]MYM41923.1 hypothetical protein [Duganella qianjiadongensis]